MKRALLIVFGLLFGLAILMPTASVHARDPFEDLCKSTPNAEVCQGRTEQQDTKTNTIYGPNGIVTKAAQLFVILVGIASVVVIVLGGLQYIMSTGDPGKISKAKDTILYAVIGVVVAVLAQAIVVYVLKKVKY